MNPAESQLTDFQILKEIRNDLSEIIEVKKMMEQNQRFNRGETGAEFIKKEIIKLANKYKKEGIHESSR